MICPNCKTEYIRGVTQCAECEVPLVDALDSSAPKISDESGIVSVWEGNDPGECATIKGALEKAGIPVIDQEAAGHFIFPSMRPKTEIYVSSADVEGAKKVLLDLGVWADPHEMTDEEREALELPESDGPDEDEPDSDPADTIENWDEDDPIAEVWAGSTREFADTLSVCLREVGIASHKLCEAGRWSVVVRSQQEPRAREIVREVVEASPPE